MIVERLFLCFDKFKRIKLLLSFDTRLQQELILAIIKTRLKQEHNLASL